MNFKKGCVIKINMGAYFHYGVADGDGYVFHNSKSRKKVAHEPLEDFAKGRRIIADTTILNIDPDMAICRAKSYIGLSYCLFTQNCEHFVRMVHGLVQESPQIKKALIMAGGVAAFCASKNQPIQLAGIAIVATGLVTKDTECAWKKSLLAGLCGLAFGLMIDSSQGNNRLSSSI